MKFEEFYPKLEPLVSGVAAEFGRTGRRYGADTEDFRQEFICWLLDHEDVIASWMDPEVNQEEADKYLTKCLRNEGKDYLVDIKAQALGYSREDLTWYSRNELKNLLPSMFDREKWHEPPASDGRSTKAPAEGGNWIAILADVAHAYDRLGSEDREMLAQYHRDGWMNKMVAAAQGVSEQVASYRHHRALGRMVTLLGGEKPNPMRESFQKVDPWRGRKAVTNEAARAYQSHVYDDRASA